MTLLVGAGNRLRGDDGAAARVLEQLSTSPGFTCREAQALLPELAAELPGHADVVFIDADLGTPDVVLQQLFPSTTVRTGLHGWSPAKVLQLALSLGFTGRAWLCRLPVERFDGEGLTGLARTGADCAATLLAKRFGGQKP
jgi:Ni,Fe-hydrogenase maturation factor